MPSRRALAWLSALFGARPIPPPVPSLALAPSPYERAVWRFTTAVLEALPQATVEAEYLIERQAARFVVAHPDARRGEYGVSLLISRRNWDNEAHLVAMAGVAVDAIRTSRRTAA